LKKHYPLLRIFFLIFLSFFTISNYAQHKDSLLAKLIFNLRNNYDMNPEEKCFAHLDKNFYQSGETIFFKAYLTLNNSFSTLSTIVYTDLSSADGKVLSKAMWKTANGMAYGSIYLFDTLSTGIYRVRCYSLWMLNQPAAIHEQYIFLQGKKEQNKTHFVPATPTNIQFYPEGGQLIENLTNRVAFRIADSNYLPVSVEKIFVSDENQNFVTSARTFDNGIGIIELKPESGKTYTLEIIHADKKRSAFKIPKAKAEGINIRAENFSDSKVFIQANATENYINQHPNILMLAHQKGKVVSLKEFKLSEAQNATVINKKELSEGLMQIIFLNEDLQLLAERWLWVQLPAKTSIQLNADTVSFAPKSKNVFHISVTGPDTPQLSVSVIPDDLPSYPFIHSPDIRSYHVIHSNETGKQFLINRLQAKDNVTSTLLLDALTLMINPVRFTWKQIQEDSLQPLNYYFESGLSLKGILKPEKNQSLNETAVEAIIKTADSTTILANASTNSQGIFSITDLDFYKSAKVFIQAAYTKGKKKTQIPFELQPSYIDTLTTIKKPQFITPLLVSSNQESDQQNHFIRNYSNSRGKELKEIIIKGKRKNERKEELLNNEYATDIYKDSEFILLPDSLANYASIWQMLQEMVPGLNVVNPAASEIQSVSRDVDVSSFPSPPVTDPGMINLTFNRYTLSNERISVQNGQSNRPDIGIALFLNELPVLASELNSVNPADIIMIKVNRIPKVTLGGLGMYSGAEGSILLYTRKRKEPGNYLMNTMTGFNKSYSFFQPDYSRQESQTIEDRRTTLFWNPDITFEKNGNAKIKFYNNSSAKSFKIIIQGMDKNGKFYFIESYLQGN
jgi:hypothetical protein